MTRHDLSASFAFADRMLEQMTLPEKAGQMAQVEKGAITPDEAAEHAVGSILSGGGGNPSPNTPEGWRAMVEPFVEASRSSRLGIPVLYGTDAVHGHNNLRGATMFPHNIGLGATGDEDLVEQVFRATAVETAATGARWGFSPTVAVALDPRWGRTYESFGDDPALVSRLGAAAVRGLQGPTPDDPSAVLACSKHFVGDGGAAWGTASAPAWTTWWDDWDENWQIDQGDARCDEDELRAVHLPPHAAAVDAGALSVMASYSSWNGEKCHGNRRLLTDVLKRELGFEGFVVSDWMGVDQLDADPRRAVVMAVGAGVDMVMVPFDFRRFIDDVVVSVESGDLGAERVDDAVRRILAVKHAFGLFSDPAPPPSLDLVGLKEHRDLAAEAAAASAVLLHDPDGVVPVRSAQVLLAGVGADDIGLQCGGWTIEWQGMPGDITPGTTIRQGLDGTGAQVAFDSEARFGGGVTAPVGIVVVAEPPYAEGMGDRPDLALPDEDVALVERMRPLVERLVLVVLSGRPLFLDPVIDRCDAVVAAWLPGTQAGGLADVLVGRRPLTGHLPRAWPAASRSQRAPSWPRGHGITR